MTEFADLNKKRKPTRKVVSIPLDGEARARREQLRRLIAAEAADNAFAGLADKGSTELHRELAEVEKQLRDSAVDFILQSISYERLEEMKMEHAPTARQKDEGAAFNYTTLGRKLVQETCVDPVLTDENLKTLVSEWEPWQVDQLVNAAWDVCNSRAVVRPFSETDSDEIPSSEGS